MSLLGKLKSLLGGGDGSADDDPRDVSVTVEREAGTASSSADATADSTTADSTASEPESTDDPETVEPTDESEPTESTDDTEAATESEPADDATPVEDIKGVGPTYADRLGEAGVNSVEELADADAEALAAETGISETRLQNWIDQAGVR